MHQNEHALETSGSERRRHQTPLALLPVIREFITQELLQRSGLELRDDTLLIEEGYLTSLETVQLVIFLEEHFEVEIDPEDVTEENFRTLAAVASLVEQKLGASEGIGR